MHRKLHRESEWKFLISYPIISSLFALISFHLYLYHFLRETSLFPNFIFIFFAVFIILWLYLLQYFSSIRRKIFEEQKLDLFFFFFFANFCVCDMWNSINAGFITERNEYYQNSLSAPLNLNISILVFLLFWNYNYIVNFCAM